MAAVLIMAIAKLIVEMENRTRSTHTPVNTKKTIEKNFIVDELYDDDILISCVSLYYSTSSILWYSELQANPINNKMTKSERMHTQINIPANHLKRIMHVIETIMAIPAIAIKSFQQALTSEI